MHKDNLKFISTRTWRYLMMTEKSPSAHMCPLHSDFSTGLRSTCSLLHSIPQRCKCAPSETATSCINRQTNVDTWSVHGVHLIEAGLQTKVKRDQHSNSGYILHSSQNWFVNLSSNVALVLTAHNPWLGRMKTYHLHKRLNLSFSSVPNNLFLLWKIVWWW